MTLEAGCVTYSQMSETLSIRLPVEDKRTLAEAAARQGQSVNAFVREAIRLRLGQDRGPAPSSLSEFFGSVDVEVPAPTNDAVRRAIRRRMK